MKPHRPPTFGARKSQVFLTDKERVELKNVWARLGIQKCAKYFQCGDVTIDKAAFGFAISPDAAERIRAKLTFE